MQRARVAATVIVCLSLFSIPASAQTYDHGNVEFAILGGFTLLTEHTGGDGATIFGVPYVLPGLRMSFWTKSPLVVDCGFSLLSVGADDDRVTALDLEAGLGRTFGPRNSRTTSFVNGLVGLLSLSTEDESHSNAYLGGQIGLRSMINDHAAFRAQVGYRYWLGSSKNNWWEEDEFDFSTLEIAMGLSFFL